MAHRVAKNATDGGGDGDLPRCRWSKRTALDPKHKPQLPYKPATTVRREWARYPQEAHLLDPVNERIRRLTATEIVRLQGFEEDWFSDTNIDEKDWIRAAGDAVPPPLSRQIFARLSELIDFEHPTHLEIAAGSGGLASGATAARLETLALVDAWPTAGRILKAHWDPELVKVVDVRRFDFDRFRDRVGVLSGGPPCQPWSSAGARRGELDDRDLMGRVDSYVARVRPRAFVWENVPGLIRGEFKEYFNDLMERLRSPADGLRYGVLAAVLNAADFGVPQVRRRLFIIGVREGSPVQVSRIFDAIHDSATQRGGPWRNVSEIVQPDAGGWMEWWYPELPRGVEMDLARGEL